ncbi:MAG: branched-chain amino acid ABC transporter permease, partial [Acidimicrobiia bacterium]
MSDFWPFVVTGLTTGSLYSIAAMGLVLTYKTSGIFNFAHGAVAAGSAYLFYEMHIRHGLAWPAAAAICILVAAPLGGVLLERMARVLANVTPAAKIVATVGLLLVIQGTTTSIYGAAIIQPEEFLPQRLYRIGGLNVGFDQLVAVAVAALAAAGLSAFFRSSRTGLAMRGVVDNADLLDLAGSNPRRVRRQAWMIGNSFAALSGILIAPKLGLEPILLTLLVVQAFGAAAVGRFSSLSLTYVGGLVLGVAGSLSTKYVADFPSLAGFPSALPFLVLFLVLLVSPKGRFVEAARRARPAADVRGFPP